MKKENRIKSGIVGTKWSPFNIVLFIILATYSCVLFGIIFWAFLTTMKTRIEYIYSAVAWPKQFSFNNYITALTELTADGKSVPMMLGNSIWLSILPPTISLFTASIASYAMAHYKFPGRNLIWGIIIFMMTMPIMGNAAARYKMLIALNFYDSPLYLLTNVSQIGGNLFLIAAFTGVSKTYAEAAFIDGAGHFKIFFKIMLPQVSGILTALWITSFIGHWNDYMTSIMYLPSFTPMTTGLYIYQVENERVQNIPVLFSAALMLMILPVVMFIIFQDKFMNLSLGGGIKG